MDQRNEQDPVARLVVQIQSDLPDTPEGMKDEEYAKLCRAIARAIIGAIQTHERRFHQVEPEFGEEHRPE